ncbi:DEAD/DEAH box helicase [Streptomyces sp. NPDC012389]|uniref:DEAD/DEAH box helicase n=1 Tax=unclassified Streptomyces TaxID=2593676 RepID=UPI00081DE472|nr:MULTISPECIES: DEAD/DEAH box helicase family protein [unclassified Streptomyces]MYR95540.1 DEAD/DEAH box helicase family protein [Streptomyces sp. SID4937]SCD92500.1 type III restriction enzyme [Streptomyces sp. ScaeMP-e83]
MSWITYDSASIEDLTARMKLRDPNRDAVSRIVQEIQSGDGREVVCDLATGVGKTYICRALIDYLAEQGVRNILIVTPGRTIQNKTIGNFEKGHPKFVPGANYKPNIITPENYAGGRVGDALHDPDALKVFIFNVHMLTKPTAKTSRAAHKTDESIGMALYEHLRNADDLVIIADEHHVYRSEAKKFHEAVRDLGPRALVGLTATPDKGDYAVPGRVIFQYSLGEAIADELVKIPVIVYREDGHNDVKTQLADACHLRKVKEETTEVWAKEKGLPVVKPVLFVVCQSIEEATEAAGILAGPGFIEDPGAVLQITSGSKDDALAALAGIEDPGSPVRAVVSVNMLKEGWDVKNISVIVALRKLASETLTEQILGRGLRLPYGERVGFSMIDTVDIVAHDSYRKLLADKEALLEYVLPKKAAPADAGSKGAGTSPGASGKAPLPAHGEFAGQGMLNFTGEVPINDGGYGEGTQSAVVMAMADMEDRLAEAGVEQAQSRTTMKPVPGAPSIVFPSKRLLEKPETYSLRFVSSSSATEKGRSFKHEIEVELHKVAINAARNVEGGVSMLQQNLKSGTATQQSWPLSKVREDLENRILNLPQLTLTHDEVEHAQRIVEAFLSDAVETDAADSTPWQEARAQFALTQLEKLVVASFSQKLAKAEYEIRTVTVPPPIQAWPGKTMSKMEIVDKVIKGMGYTGWEQSILPVVHFDALSTEVKLANLMDVSSKVEWWLRLEARSGTFIQLESGARYYPDFVAVDKDGVHWLVEGKRDSEAESESVLAKKAAAEAWAKEVTDLGQFGTWKYLFVTESHLAQSISWDTLLTVTGARER